MQKKIPMRQCRPYNGLWVACRLRERHAGVGMPYERFVGTAFIAIGAGRTESSAPTEKVHS